MLVRIESTADAWPRVSGCCAAARPAALAVCGAPLLSERGWWPKLGPSWAQFGVPSQHWRCSAEYLPLSRCARPNPRLLTTALMYRAGLLTLRAPELSGRGRPVYEAFARRLLALPQSMPRARVKGHLIASHTDRHHS
jgi:hypothetical protein